MSKESWAAITQCVGPWEGGGPMTLEYDIAVLGEGYDPYNVLTSICHRCGKAWSYDSPSGECGGCERETLIEYLIDEREVKRGYPPRYRKPASRGRREVLIAPSFVESWSKHTGQDAKEARADLREQGLHLHQARPTADDREREEMRRHVREFYEQDVLTLSVEQQAAWRKWWDTRTTFIPSCWQCHHPWEDHLPEEQGCTHPECACAQVPEA